MIDDLVAALTRQKLCPTRENKNLLLVYEGETAKAIQTAREYREKGYAAVLMKLEKEKQCYEKFAADNNFSQVLFID